MCGTRSRSQVSIGFALWDLPVQVRRGGTKVVWRQGKAVVHLIEVEVVRQLTCRLKRAQPMWASVPRAPASPSSGCSPLLVLFLSLWQTKKEIKSYKTHFLKIQNKYKICF